MPFTFCLQAGRLEATGCISRVRGHRLLLAQEVRREAPRAAGAGFATKAMAGPLHLQTHLQGCSPTKTKMWNSPK